MHIPPNVTVTTWRVRVCYVDTDQAGVMHHGTYFRYLEAARVEHLRERGLDYKRFEMDNKFALPVVEANIRYKIPARFDDELAIHTWIGLGYRAKMRFDSVIMRGDDLLTRAQVTLACIRLPEGKICSVPTMLLDFADPQIRGKRKPPPLTSTGAVDDD